MSKKVKSNKVKVQRFPEGLSSKDSITQPKKESKAFFKPDKKRIIKLNGDDFSGSTKFLQSCRDFSESDIEFLNKFNKEMSGAVNLDTYLEGSKPIHPQSYQTELYSDRYKFRNDILTSRPISDIDQTREDGSFIINPPADELYEASDSFLTALEEYDDMIRFGDDIAAEANLEAARAYFTSLYGKVVVNRLERKYNLNNKTDNKNKGVA